MRLYRVTGFPADDGTLLLEKGTGDTPRAIIRGPDRTDTPFPVENVAFFIEAQILRSSDGSAIAYDPVYLWFGAVGQKRVLGSNGTRNLVVQFSLAPPAEKVNLAQGAGGAILLGDVTTGEQKVLRQTFKADPTRLASVWQPAPKIGSTAQPLVLRALLTETRDESAALRLLGDAVSNIKVE